MNTSSEQKIISYFRETEDTPYPLNCTECGDAILLLETILQASPFLQSSEEPNMDTLIEQTAAYQSKPVPESYLKAVRAILAPKAPNAILVFLETNFRVIAEAFETLFTVKPGDFALNTRKGNAPNRAVEAVKRATDFGDCNVFLSRESADSLSLSLSCQKPLRPLHRLQLRRDDRLLQSIDYSSGFASFNRLSFGEYEITITDTEGHFFEPVNVSVRQG